MKYPIIHQPRSSDCGPTCLAMVAAFYGRPQSIPHLRQLARTDGRGTNLAGLVAAARALDLVAWGVRAEINALKRIGLPAIAHWAEGGRNHFVVVFECRRSRVIIGDPASGLRQLRLTEFEDRWTGVLLLLKEPTNP